MVGKQTRPTGLFAESPLRGARGLT